MDFQNLKKLAQTAKKNNETALKAEERSIVGDLELPFVDASDSEGPLHEFLKEFGA